jgi:hypothetical protein
MRGGALPPALLAAALGFALAFVPRRFAPIAIALFAILAIAASFLSISEDLADPIFYGCWASVIATAACVHLPKGLPRNAGLILAANAGAWTGALIAVAGAPLDLLKALPWVAVCFPAAWVIGRGGQIAVKVVASWLIAVALLAAALPTVTPTPGYAPDHME